jgi:hypothetical protein
VPEIVELSICPPTEWLKVVAVKDHVDIFGQGLHLRPTQTQFDGILSSL